MGCSLGGGCYSLIIKMMHRSPRGHSSRLLNNMMMMMMMIRMSAKELRTVVAA